jgi:riboflavin biosynthesis pyrimidine reductase
VRALLPCPVADVDVHAVYAEGWVETGGVRFNMLASIDGAASALGLSAGLQTPGDNRVFAALRDLADVVVAGSGTVLAEGYGPITLSAARTEVRRRFGLADSLPTAVLTRTLRLDPDAPLFDGSAEPRTLVLTCAAADAQRRAALARRCDVVICGDETVEPALLRAALRERGLRRTLCEGGPTVLGSFAAAAALDELCVSVTPLLAGPGAPRIVAGQPWTGLPRPAELVGLLEEDGALFLRLRMAAGPATAVGAPDTMGR